MNNRFFNMPINNKVLLLVLHVLAWFILFSLPYFLLTLDATQDQVLLKTFIRSWVHLFFYGIIFYINYLYLIDKLLFSNKLLQFIGINVIIIGVSIMLREHLKASYFDQWLDLSSEETRKMPRKEMSIYFNIIATIVPIAFAVALKTTERWVKIEKATKEAATLKLQTEIQHLRYQLQPHFFFNSLNNIYSLVDVAPEQAKSTLHSLSKLMRYLLYETNTSVIALSKEIDFLKKYIDLMELRTSDKTKISYSFPLEETQIQIAPLLFISLIENAFKHGVSATQESEIKIALTTEDNLVIFKIENTNFPKTTTDKSGSGIGLQNLKKGLALLYADKYTFETQLKDGIYSVDLRIET
ncbi:sensor histidine kinase [Cellulophaga baltica]|uniref:sensor histidine kinase n=1 Tax=Cellulophaga baltica TaxID=76594 RepID=UPI0024951AC9|nr:histidine kinase [Cellulophaga baltica]